MLKRNRKGKVAKALVARAFFRQRDPLRNVPKFVSLEQALGLSKDMLGFGNGIKVWGQPVVYKQDALLADIMHGIVKPAREVIEKYSVEVNQDQDRDPMRDLIKTWLSYMPPQPQMAMEPIRVADLDDDSPLYQAVMNSSKLRPLVDSLVITDISLPTPTHDGLTTEITIQFGEIQDA
jgi:hypothetical protein